MTKSVRRSTERRYVQLYSGITMGTGQIGTASIQTIRIKDCLLTMTILISFGKLVNINYN